MLTALMKLQPRPASTVKIPPDDSKPLDEAPDVREQKQASLQMRLTHTKEQCC